MGQPRPLIRLFLLFSTTIFLKIVRVSGIRTRIVGVEGEHADHCTNTSMARVDKNVWTLEWKNDFETQTFTKSSAGTNE